MKKPNKDLPLYKQMINPLHEQLEAGFYKPGQMIPSERALCEYYGVSRISDIFGCQQYPPLLDIEVPVE